MGEGGRGGIVWTVSAKLGHVLEASLVSTISFDADEKGRQEEKGERMRKKREREREVY